MKRKIYTITVLGLFLIMLILLITFSLLYRQPLADEGWNLRPVSDVDLEIESGEKERISLPFTIKDLSPGTRVIIRSQVQIMPGESIYVKSVFAPMDLYINDKLFYQYGQKGTYPSFMNDPPTGLAVIPLPEEGGLINLRAEYKSLSQRSSLSLPAFFVGEHSALLNRLLKLDGFSFLFSLMLIFLGLIMTFIALTFIRKVPSGASFLWLGLFSLSAGIWVFGECDFASRLLPYPSFLYIIDYIGLFSLAIPFLQFGFLMLEPENKLPIKIMLWVHYISLMAALVLQLFGWVDFIRSLYWFHIITPLAFVVFAACLLWEGLKYRNSAARRFGPAVLLLALSTILELANYWLHLTGTLTLFFQLGVLAFVVSLGIVSGYYVRESLNNAAEKHRLEYEMKGMERQLSLQRLQYQKIMDNEERIKSQQHDFRHHLAVLKGLNEKGDKEGLASFIDSLGRKIPTDKETFICENYAVNAVGAYYYNQAKQEGIDISVSLAIPKSLNRDVENDLCVIIGNLMENALEACGRMKSEKGFIRVNSSLNHNILTLAVDNSYYGDIKKEGDAFLSSKRKSIGIGISSVRAAAKKYGGNSKFEANGGIFKASIYLNI